MYSHKPLTNYLYISGNYSFRKLARLFWIILIVISLSFWIYFLYSYTFDHIFIPKKVNQDYYQLKITSSEKKIYNQDFLSSSNAFSNLNIKPNDILQTSITGLDKNDIEKIVKNKIENFENEGRSVDVTAIIHYKDSSLESLINAKEQVKAVLNQYIHPKFIWVVCFSNRTKDQIEQSLELPNSKQFQIILYPDEDIFSEVMLVKGAPWLFESKLDVKTNYIWILEPYSIPDESYLYYTYNLIHSSEYENTLLGYDTSLLVSSISSSPFSIQCQRSQFIDKTQYVDMIHGSWVLKTSWISLLRGDSSINKVKDLPLAYFISNSLRCYGGIESVVIPSTKKFIYNSSCQKLMQKNQEGSVILNRLNSVYPNVIDRHLIVQEQHKNFAVLLDSTKHAIELMPLICKLFNNKQFNLHIILANGIERFEFLYLLEQTECANQKLSGFVHDLTSAYNNGVVYKYRSNKIDYLAPIAHLLKFIQPKVMIQVKDPNHEYYFDALKSVAKTQNTTLIGLPSNEVSHAMWLSDLSIDSLSHWNTIKIDLVVITDRRPKSLSRLLESINNATYLGCDNMELIVNMDQTADIDTQTIVENFNFKYGYKKIRHRIRKGGLVPAIVESWYPSNDNNYGLILEDDIELSPFFYSWSKYNILKYRYESNALAYKHVYGVSLYSPRNLELLPEGRRPFNPETVLESAGYPIRSPYGSQIPCSWGAIYFPQHWREFHKYLNEHLDKEDKFKSYYNITVPNSRSERWKKSWKKYFIELTYLRAYVMIYPNYQNFESFSTNHLEYGTHFNKKKKERTLSRIEQFKVPLMQNDSVLSQLPNQLLPSFENLPLMDLWGQVRTLDELDRIGSEWHKHISSCNRRTGTYSPDDILCVFESNIEAKQ